MSHPKRTFEQMARMLFEYQPGINSAAVARRYGLSPQSVWLWRGYKGLDAKWLQHVKDLEHRLVIASRQCSRLNERLAIATSLIKRFQPSAKQRAVLATALRAAHGLDRKNANLIVGLSEGTGDQASVVIDQNRLIVIMRNYLTDHPTAGFERMFQSLLRDAPGSRRKALLLYREKGFSLQKRAVVAKRQRLPPRRMPTQSYPDQVWSMDFMVDALACGQRYWVLAVLDDFNREAITIRAVPRNTAKAVTEALGDALQAGRKPSAIRTDNGGEFHSVTYLAWTQRRGIARILSRPGKPTENAFVESFNGTLRREIFNRFDFGSLEQVQECLDSWRQRYNLVRPQKNLGWLSPKQYAQIHAKQ